MAEFIFGTPDTGVQPSSPAYTEFCEARQRMVASWMRWMETRPPGEFAEEEMKATRSVMLQLAGLGDLDA